MSERKINDPQSAPQAPTPVDADARQLASARRRRFIKLGGAAVPTALTLASRPVMAWHCNTASTWGSAQGTSNSAYTRSQDPSRLFTDETYTLDNWRYNTGRAGLSAPWKRLNSSLSTTDSAASTYYQYYTVQQLLGSTASISGVSSADSVWSILNGAPKKPVSTKKNGKTTWSLGSSSGGSQATDFQKLMLVAWMNFKVGNQGLTKCLAPNNANALVAFGNLSYRESTSRPVWTKEQVLDYLQKNWIAVKS